LYGRLYEYSEGIQGWTDITLPKSVMLVGAAIGGILSVIGFMLWHSTITFSFAFAGIALGILGGSIMDKKLKKSKRENKEFL